MLFLSIASILWNIYICNYYTALFEQKFIGKSENFRMRTPLSMFFSLDNLYCSSYNSELNKLYLRGNKWISEKYVLRGLRKRPAERKIEGNERGYKIFRYVEQHGQGFVARGTANKQIIPLVIQEPLRRVGVVSICPRLLLCKPLRVQTH